MKKKIFIFTILLAFLGGFLVFTNFALAQGDTLSNLSDIAGKARLNEGRDLPTLLGQILGAALSFVGVIFLLLMIYGGVLWMTASGNAQHTDKALNIIIAAVVGLIIVLGSYVLVNFVFTTAEQRSVGSTASCVTGSDPSALICTGGPCTGIDEATCKNRNPKCCVWQ